MTVARFREPSVLTSRLILVALLFVGGALVDLLGLQGGRLPAGEYYRASRQQLVHADLMYRMAEFLQLLQGRTSLSFANRVRDLTEGAIATYERQSLVPRPNPVALQRLGIIYGRRGYHQQAQAVFNRAAALDERHADLYFALADVYGPQAGRALPPGSLRQLMSQEDWLADLSLETYYRLTDNTAAYQQVQSQAAEHVWRFGLHLLLLFGVYGLLGVAGLAIVLVAIIRRGFYVVTTRQPHPPLLVPWEPLDAFEAVGVLYFISGVLGVALGLLIALPLMKHVSSAVTVFIMMVQYLLFTGITLVVLWHRIGAATKQRLRILGYRARHYWSLIAQGVGTYGVLVLVLVGASLLLGHGTGLGSLIPAASGEQLISQARGTPATILLFVLICVIAPIVEETIFRGFVYPGLRRRLPAFSAVVLSALIFAWMHRNPAAMLPIGLIGIALAILYERTRSLVPCMVCHALNNTLVFFLFMLIK